MKNIISKLINCPNCAWQFSPNQENNGQKHYNMYFGQYTVGPSWHGAWRIEGTSEKGFGSRSDMPINSTRTYYDGYFFSNKQFGKCLSIEIHNGFIFKIAQNAPDNYLYLPKYNFGFDFIQNNKTKEINLQPVEWENRRPRESAVNIDYSQKTYSFRVATSQKYRISGSFDPGRKRYSVEYLAFCEIEFVFYLENRMISKITAKFIDNALTDASDSFSYNADTFEVFGNFIKNKKINQNNYGLTITPENSIESSAGLIVQSNFSQNNDLFASKGLNAKFSNYFFEPENLEIYVSKIPKSKMINMPPDSAKIIKNQISESEIAHVIADGCVTQILQKTTKNDKGQYNDGNIQLYGSLNFEVVDGILVKFETGGIKFHGEIE